MEKITVQLIDECNRHGGYTAELLEGAASEIDLLRDENAQLREELKAQTRECRKAIDIGTGYGYRAEKAESALAAATLRAERLERALERIAGFDCICYGTGTKNDDCNCQACVAQEALAAEKGED